MHNAGAYFFERGQSMNIKNSLKNLTKFEKMLWLISFACVVICFVFSPEKDWLNFIASSVGVSALIFVAKGDVLGQILTVFFSLLYGIISYTFDYYGEMITYLGMTMPIALVSVISWLKHPYEKGKNEVEVSHLTKSKTALTFLVSLIVTAIFYFILKHFGTNNLIVSTISITTSFLASAFMVLRCEYYAVAYAANDIVLIVLWILATIEDTSYIPMVVCFAMFFINDIYGFINWRRMKSRQNK